MAHYVARIVITKVEDRTSSTVYRGTEDETKRGSVTELASIAVQASELQALVEKTKGHLDLVS